MPAAIAYAISITDEVGRVWFLVRPMALHGSMIRTLNPFDALTFANVTEAKLWLAGLKPHWRAQLEGRDVEIRLVVASIDDVADVIRMEPFEMQPGTAQEAVQLPAPFLAGEGVCATPSPSAESTGPAPSRKRTARRGPRKEAVPAAGGLLPLGDEPGGSVAVLELPQVESPTSSNADDQVDDDDEVPPPKSGMAWFRPSFQQAKFMDALHGTDGHLLLEARAGSGKSTTCKAAAWQLHEQGRRSVYSCFNSSIAQEFRGDLPPSCNAATMHSLGLALLRDASGGSVQVDDEKLDRIFDKYFSPKHRYQRMCARRLIGIAKNTLLTDFSFETLMGIALDYGIDLPQWGAEDVLAIIEPAIEACKQTTSSIDFDDMIWLPVVSGLSSQHGPDVLFIDEAQDLNACQHSLLDLLCPGGRVVVVGDRFQSIYRFRGADSQSIPKFEAKLSESERGLNRLPLTVSRRCPRRHVEAARWLVPDLDHLPDAIDGVIRSVDEAKWQHEARPGDLVLCRTNAPLVSACYRLIRSGVRATVRGRDIGKGLLTLIARLKPTSVSGLIRGLGDYRATEIAKIEQLRNPEPKLASLNDKVDCLIALCDGAQSVDEVRQRAEEMFSDVTDDSVVQLSSIHRAKGLERGRVIILRPDLLPGPWATHAEDVQQERNLTYVAATRAKEELIYAGPVPALLKV